MARSPTQSVFQRRLQRFITDELDRAGSAGTVLDVVADTKAVVKRMETRVALVVPYRDQKEQNRAAQLDAFMAHMTAHAPDNVRVYIIEQSSDGRKFNRGMLLNIGAVIAQRSGAMTLILHDVDLLPSPELMARYYRPLPHAAVHVGSAWDGPYTYGSYCGGVVAVSAALFQVLNGYPNNFWGWGGEDDVFGRRYCDATGRRSMEKVPDALRGSLRDLETTLPGTSVMARQKLAEGGRADFRNMRRKEQLVAGDRDRADNGVRQVEFDVVAQTSSFHGRHARITVQLKPAPAYARDVQWLTTKTTPTAPTTGPV